METAGKASVGHAAFPTLHVGLVLQPMGATRHRSCPENISACPAGRGKGRKQKGKEKDGQEVKCHRRSNCISQPG